MVTTSLHLSPPEKGITTNVLLFVSSPPLRSLNTFPIAFAEIKWHDYTTVQTIEFAAADANFELPPPMSVQEVENMTLVQKRMAAMIMETTAEDVEAHCARQAVADTKTAAAVGGAGIGGKDNTRWIKAMRRMKKVY
jgi:hypothetical protein